MWTVDSRAGGCLPVPILCSMLSCSPRVAIVLAVLLASAVVSALQRATPVLTAFERVPAGGGSVLHVLAEPDRGVGWRAGMAFQCRPGVRPVVAVFLGPFPPDRRPVQLAIRTPDGRVERFGGVFAAGPESGFNDTYLEAPAEQRRFARAALQYRALVSNGYNSFWNGASAPANRRVLDALVACGL